MSSSLVSNLSLFRDVIANQQTLTGDSGPVAFDNTVMGVGAATYDPASLAQPDPEADLETVEASTFFQVTGVASQTVEAMADEMVQAAPVLRYLSRREQITLARQTILGANPDEAADLLFSANETAARQALIHNGLVATLPVLTEIDPDVLKGGVIEIANRVLAGENIDEAANAVLQGTAFQRAFVANQLDDSIPSWALLPDEAKNALTDRAIAGESFSGVIDGDVGNLNAAELRNSKDGIKLTNEKLSPILATANTYGTVVNRGRFGSVVVSFDANAQSDYQTLRAMEARLNAVNATLEQYGQVSGYTYTGSGRLRRRQETRYLLYRTSVIQRHPRAGGNQTVHTPLSRTEAVAYRDQLKGRIDAARPRVLERYQAFQRLQSEGLIQVTGQHLALAQGSHQGLADFSQIRWDETLGLVTNAGNYIPPKKKKSSFLGRVLGFVAIAVAVVIGAPYLVPTLTGVAAGGVAAGAGLSLGATMLQAGLISAGLTLVQGGDIGDALKAGFLGAATAGVGGYVAPQAVSALGLTGSKLGTAVVTGVVRSGVSAIIHGDSLERALLQGAAGGVGRYFGGVAVNSLTQFTDNAVLLDVASGFTERVVADALNGGGFSGLDTHLQGAAANAAGNYVSGQVSDAVDLGDSYTEDVLEDAIATATGSLTEGVILGREGGELWALVRDDVTTDVLTTVGETLGNALFPVAQTAPVTTGAGDSDAAADSAEAIAAEPILYQVEDGDTLWEIAGGNIELIGRIMADNGIADGIVTPGQTLIIRPQAASEIESSYHMSIGLNLGVNLVRDQAPQVVNVKAGDTLWDLADGDVELIGRIMADNGLSSSFIYPGQELVIRPDAGVSSGESETHAAIGQEILEIDNARLEAIAAARAEAANRASLDDAGQWTIAQPGDDDFVGPLSPAELAAINAGSATVQTLPADFDAEIASQRLSALQEARMNLLRVLRDTELSQTPLTAEEQELYQERLQTLAAFSNSIEQLKTDLNLYGVPATTSIELDGDFTNASMMYLGDVMTTSVVPSILNGTIPTAFIGGAMLSGAETGGGALMASGAFAAGEALMGQGLSRELVEQMLDSDTATSATIKLFSKNGTAGSTQFPINNPLAEVVDLGALPNAPIANGTAKLHGWLATSAAVSVTRPALSLGNEELRTVSFTYMLGAQPEVSAAARAPGVTLKSLTTGAVGGTYTYSITATQDRLREIMSGAAALPDLNDTSTLRSGDTITWDLSAIGTLSEDLRLLNSAGVGLDLTPGGGISGGARTVVRIQENAATGDTHAVVFDGSSYSDALSVAFGVMENGAIPETRSPGVLNEVSARFVKAQIGIADTDIDNRFRFADINLDKAQGAAIFSDFSQTGMLPTNMTMLEGQGAIVAHGTLDFEVDSDTLDFIAAGYFENAINGRQLSTTGSVNLGQSTTATRSFNLINALPTSVLSGGEGANTSLSAHMLTGAAGSTGVSDSLVEVSGNNRYSQKEAAYLSDDGASFVVQESDYIVGSGLLEWNLISLINNDIRRQEDSGSSVFSAIEVEADDGAILTGAAAMEYLEAHSDPNAGWLFDPDRVNIEMTTENGDTWRDFTARVATDARAYLNNTTERYADLSTYAPGQAFAYMLNNVFGTGGVTPNNQLQLLEYANNADAVQVDAVAQGQSLARSAAGFLQIAPFLHEQSDQNVPYPVRIRIFARQEEPETHVVPQYPEVPVDAISGP